MTDKDDNDPKPDLKVVPIDTKRDEQEALKEAAELDLTKFTVRAVNMYAMCRAVFTEIDDPEIEIEAVHHLRKAFLLAINPLQQVDDQFEFIYDDEEDFED